jgi:hypothetical protein
MFNKLIRKSISYQTTKGILPNGSNKACSNPKRAVTTAKIAGAPLANGPLNSPG